MPTMRSSNARISAYVVMLATIELNAHLFARDALTIVYYVRVSDRRIAKIACISSVYNIVITVGLRWDNTEAYHGEDSGIILRL